MCRNVYGGGLYAAIGTPNDAEKGNTNVYITGGNVDNVYGGGVMGDILTSTNVNIGLHDEALSFDGRTYEPLNEKITIFNSVFGGNDVSGKVTHANVMHNGGTISQDIYGAGNGNYRGYYTPALCDFADGDNDNYYYIDHSGDIGSTGDRGPEGNAYKGRPQTSNVNITIAGNNAMDKAVVLGQVFGGGNSCTIGEWESNLNSKYEGDPHKWSDDPEYFLGGGNLNITLGSHVKIGRSHKELVDAGDEEYLNKDGENVSGLFMGCSGKYLATQSTAKDDNLYHYYYDSHTAKYWPGFAVYQDGGSTPLTRAEGLKSFNAYLNNILVWSDNVHLNIEDEVEDIWLANFVGGGFRGSMKAKSENGRFAYKLPEGVTIGNAVVGGAYNTDVVYRIFETSDGHTYTESNGHYKYQTDASGLQVVDEEHPDGDYHHMEYAEDGETPISIVRFYYDGGMLASNNEGRAHQVHADPRADETAYATAYFEPLTEGDDAEDETTKAKLFTRNKDKALVYLDLRCALEPEVLVSNENDHSVHGGNVFGGCFMSGLVQGDSWVDYGAWLSQNCTDKYYFDKTNNMHIYSEAADLQRNNALNIFGAGYGEDTHTVGDTYLYIKAIAQTAGGDGNKNGKFPYIFNAFGGSNMGRVLGNTNVYYAVGKQGTLLGSLYGGGYKGDIEGNTFVELAEGFVTNVYGGSRQANIKGAAHVWAYDGKSRGIADANHLIICNLYGGNDIAGTISGTMPAKFTETKWNAAPTGNGTPRESLTGKTFNSYVEIASDDNSANRGFPLIGSAYAGGNGENWTEESGNQPTVGTALIEIDGGSTLRAFGGGNMATVTSDTYIFTDAKSTTFANVTFSEYQKNIMEKVFFSRVTSGYTWEGNTLKLTPYHVGALFGGNNLATMEIQPTWNLKQGRLENVYSGGNMGDMTYYNHDHNDKPKGLSITIDSDDIHIETLYGGCRMSDVRATDNNGDEVEFADNEYGATLNIKAGFINKVYGGNDISGTVTNGTNVNISGAVSGNVYGSGNGNYYYQWDKDVTKVTETFNKEFGFAYYKVPMYYGNADANDAEKILTINHWRPSVHKAYLNISGTEDKMAYVRGNVYCGGNASTIEGMDSHTKFDIGSYVTLNGVFMGSDGMEFSTTDNIRRLEYLNGFNMTDDVQWPASWTDKDGNACDAAVTDGDKQFYPTMLSLYMKAVEMNALPKGFQEALDIERTNAYIGTFCGGGNCGSMTINHRVDMTLPSNITIYDKVVAGCLDANKSFKNGTKEVTNIGGYYRPIRTSARAIDLDRTKLNYTIECQFVPLVMDVPADKNALNAHGDDFTTAEAKGFLYTNTGKALIRNTEVPAYNVGCNIYGGCYHSGDILGDVVLNVKSSLLAEPLSTPEKRALLDNTVKAETAAFNVYGAGFDMGSHVYGNVTITLDNTPVEGTLPEFDKLTCPSASNINGGGRSGYLYGNSYINILNGIVYNNVIGGSDAGYQYGSTHIAVGDPDMYECKTQGTYTLDRADKWNEDKVNHDGTHPVTTSINLIPGDRVSEAVYNKITNPGDAFTPCYVREDGSRLDWTNRKIHIGAGVYAGGYALATGSAVYAGDYTVRRLNATNRWKDVSTGEDITTLDGYAGNANIMIADNPANTSTGTTDHITISTIVDREKSGMTNKMGYFTRTPAMESDGVTPKRNALGDPVYSYDHQSAGAPTEGTTYYELSGNGGIYGDGHLSFVEGFRSADIQRYGYAEHAPQDPKLLNTMQRLDFVRVQDCCLMLQGATDFAVNAHSGIVYSIARVRELYLESNIDSSTTLDPGTKNSDLASADRRHETRRSRNYLGFFNNVHYIGTIATNDEFSTAKYHDETGVYIDKTYQANKQDYIDADYDEENHVVKDGDHYTHFKQRNIGTARNMIGINNGYTLKVQNVYTTATQQPDGSYVDVTDHIYYGPVVGVCEVKLLTLVVGEGGGYVYADNVHSDGSHFMNTSGNFVFPGTVDDNNPQYVVDDCFPKNFAGTTSSTPHQAKEAHDDERPAHYWYVMGNKYFFTNTITAYTYGDEDFIGTKDISFDMDNLDQIITLSGTKKSDVVRIKNVNWEHPHYSHYTQSGQSCDIANTEKGYSLKLSASTSDTYNEDGGYTLLPRTDSESQTNLTYSPGADNGQESPLLAIRLNDSEVNNTANYWRDHLSDPCRVTFELESGTGDPKDIYTYHITLNIVYVQGPRVTGQLYIDNCAMPGELIHAEAKNLVIETDEAMPVTGTSWRLVNPDPLATDKDKYVYVVSYNKYIDHYKADVMAKYRYNGWGLQYVVHAGGNSFPVSLASDSKFSSLLVHNYHDMEHVNIVKESATDALDPQAGARIYIKGKDDWDAFVSYLNLSATDNTLGIPVGLEGMKIYLQSDINLTAVPEISVPFKGELNGDGYNVTIPSGSLFGDNLAVGAKVYNLGLIGGSSVTTVENVTENCFVKETNDDFLYGKKAYDLSHHYHTTDAAEGYINGNRYAKGEEIDTDVYAAGDWQYAHTDGYDSRMLRTDNPNYGSVNTKHNIAHTAKEIEVHDCLFFGQALNPDGIASTPYPQHIDDSKATLGAWNETNRVYRTNGYYRSTTADIFHYNKEAWALQPTLTAIDFTAENADGDFYGHRDDRPTAIFSFDSDNNAAILPYSNENVNKVTQNLLVYHNEDKGIIADEADNTSEAQVTFHPVKKTVDAYTTPYLHLVDKQEFCAPIAFNVTNRAWYERMPAYWAESNNDAWEGICLPFTVKKVETETNGEITHFYGTPTEEQIANPATNDKTLHHEYWLRGLVSVGSADDKTIANFLRPGTEGEGLFDNDNQTAAAFNYIYAANEYFTGLSGYNKADNTWYTQQHEYADYLPQTANIPYLISIPGSRYYEFNLTEKNIIFSNDGSTTVPVSTDLTTEADGYIHTGTFLYVDDAAYGMNETGTAFTPDANTVVPFRTFMSQGAALSAKSAKIFIGTCLAASPEQFEITEPEIKIPEDYLRIYVQDRSVIVESSDDCILPCHGIAGTLIGMWKIQRGINTFSNLRTGIYIIGGKKIVVK